jgi:hypothetical protein
MEAVNTFETPVNSCQDYVEQQPRRQDLHLHGDEYLCFLKLKSFLLSEFLSTAEG